MRASSYPYPPYAWSSARRSAVLLVLLHLVSRFLSRGAAPSATASVIVVACTVAIVWLDGWRFREHLFHANLGTSPAWATGISIGVAGLLEALLRTFG